MQSHHNNYIANPNLSKGKASPQIEKFFKVNPHFNPRKDKLLDIRPAHRWFQQLHLCVEADTYIFQMMFEGRQGPEAYVEGIPMHVFSSYDYLGLIGHPSIDQAAIEAIRVFGTGTGGVRLLTGTNELHDQLEHAMATFKGAESAMVFTSGYLANIAAITGLFDSRDVVITDEYVHRSIVDGVRLAGIPCKTFLHNDTKSLRKVLISSNETARRMVIIVEGIYSMDGDICPLPEIVDLKEEFDAVLIVDEAHSLGVLGKSGRGVNEHFNIDSARIDIFTGSLSKAIPSNGGFITAREEVVHFLKHGGAPFMFSAALSPPNTAAALTALEVIVKENWRLENLWENSRLLLNGLKGLRLNVGTSESPIIPLIMGNNESAFSLSRKLFDVGYLATAVIYPAVPHDMARLRLCCTSMMSKQVIQDFLIDIQKCV